MIVKRDNLLQLGDTLRESRQWHQLTQRQLAEAVDCSFVTISRVENMVAIPRIDMLASICDALGLEIQIKEKGK